MADWAFDETLVGAAHASGRLPAPLRLLIDTRAALDPATFDAARDGDVVAGALLEAAEPSPLSPDAMSDALARIDALEPEAAAPAAVARAAGGALQELLGLPEPARSAALAAIERGGWKFAGLGIKRLDLVAEGAMKAQLLRIEPGAGAPLHSHAGDDYTQVLRGAFNDGTAVFRRGDLCVADPETTHVTSAERGDVCIALAVTDAPLEFKGLLGLVQKAFGRPN